jgi:hypothetical protein
MNNTLIDLAQLIDTQPVVRLGVGAVDYAVVRQFILDHISHQQRQVYEVIHTYPECTSSVVEVALGLNRHHAGNILTLLVRLKLVERKKVAGVYRYKVAGSDRVAS